MERNTRSIIPPSQMNNNNKPRNTISPREMNSNYNHQSHYNNYSNQQNHQSHSHSHPPAYHPNSELINFVSNAWKEKVASAEYFKPENTTEKVNLFDLDSWLNAKMRNS